MGGGGGGGQGSKWERGGGGGYSQFVCGWDQPQIRGDCSLSNVLTDRGKEDLPGRRTGMT